MKALWNELSPAGRIALVVGVAATTASVVAAARRDLAKRARPRSGATRDVGQGDEDAWRGHRIPHRRTQDRLAGPLSWFRRSELGISRRGM